MSCYVLDREHFIAIAAFVQKYGEGGGGRKLFIHHPDMRALKGNEAEYLAAHEAANILLIGNLESVSFRYNEQLESMPVIRDRDVLPQKSPTAVEMFGRLHSLRYQSCERDDYNGSLAHEVLNAVLWLAGKVAADQAGAEAWA